MPGPEASTRNMARSPLLAALACLIGLACNTAVLAPTPAIPALIPTAPAPTLVAVTPGAASGLATPSAQEPAAGICGSFDGPVVEFRIEPGIPDPRCAVVKPDQQLKVTNATDGPLDIMIGTYSAQLEPGGEYLIGAPFGDYLAPGVHHLQVLPCCGPELVLEDATE